MITTKTLRKNLSSATGDDNSTQLDGV